MRFALPALLLVATVAPAAPVPTDLKADNARLEAFWIDLAAPRWVDRARAVYDLLDHPKGVEFLCGKVSPVSATADDFKKWLKAINSDDEKEWKPALAELEYHDPRSVLTTAEQVELVDTDAGKKRLMNIWMPGFLHNSERTHKVTLRWKGAKVWCEWYVGDNGMSSEFEVPQFHWYDRAGWQRAALAAHILHCTDTKSTRAALARLADGHKDAAPTKTAAELLRAKVPTPEVEFTDKHWDALAFDGPAKMVAAAVALREAKNVPAVLKEKLPAITVTKEQLTRWVQALDSEENAVWKPAFTELCYFRPSLGLTLSEQCDLVTTVPGCTLLFQFWSQDGGSPPPRMTISKGFVLASTDDGLTVGWPHLRPPPPPLVAIVPELSKQTCVQWQRARLAVVALERNGSAEAKAVLKQLADGHPDILPTKEAKAALERMK